MPVSHRAAEQNRAQVFPRRSTLNPPAHMGVEGLVHIVGINICVFVRKKESLWKHSIGSTKPLESVAVYMPGLLAALQRCYREKRRCGRGTDAPEVSKHLQVEIEKADIGKYDSNLEFWLLWAELVPLFWKRRIWV